MNTKFLYLFIAIGLFFISGCAQDSSGAATLNTQQNSQLNVPQDSPLRPSEAEMVITRPIAYQSDSRISYCEVTLSKQNTYTGFRDQTMYPLASLSKVITTAWALKKLGPDFKFKTTWFLNPVKNQNGVFDAYLKTNFDPIFNIEKILFSLSELNKKGVLSIRNLVIDETTHIFLSVLSDPHIDLDKVPINSTDSAQNLKLILNSQNWSSQTQAAKEKLQAWAIVNNKILSIPTYFSVEDVQVKKSVDIITANYNSQVVINSSSLLKYLKNLNVYSNNYVTDALFEYLGGTEEFKKFQISELKIVTKDLQFLTGSGLAETETGIRKDNLGTCVSMLKVLKYVDQLTTQLGINLGHILYNPTQDLDGTFDGSLKFSNQVLFKTGRLYDNPALNLAGVISTKSGTVYFSFLGHDFLESDSAEIEKIRDNILSSALSYYSVINSYLTLNEYKIFLD
ncbi:MAG: D-alanyl-D-alanine carboxypeptidase [Pseudobdellovibrio sp.]